ncbi:hypothetical protein ACFV1F_28745 [Streptomyces sp. NPDC059590]|uniref:hypothetical protein n=1 Tax=unclassified Streptomyces TaxID=2593676 RepID=UPI00369E1B75
MAQIINRGRSVLRERSPYQLLHPGETTGDDEATWSCSSVAPGTLNRWATSIGPGRCKIYSDRTVTANGYRC